MKKILAFCLLISLLIGLVGCGKKAHIVFPFAASDVTKIEVIYKDGESDAQKKTVNKETEIDSLYKSFSELSVQEKDCASADTLGSVVFTFYLADGTSYEINYLSFATKSGRLQSENAGFDYFTSGDLVGLWENLSGESKVVSLRTLLDISVFKKSPNKSLTARHPSVFFAWMPFVISSSSPLSIISCSTNKKRLSVIGSIVQSTAFS